jgi:hypothetical protein
MVVVVISILLYFFRDTIKREWFKHKVKPILKKTLNVYREKVLPEYVEKEPELKVVLKKEDLPEGAPFGYIFVSPGQEELAWETMITFVPVSSSLKGIRVLFDENLRRGLFDYLSYRLGSELGREDIAVNFRDKALKSYPEDYETIERLCLRGANSQQSYFTRQV